MAKPRLVIAASGLLVAGLIGGPVLVASAHQGEDHSQSQQAQPTQAQPSPVATAAPEGDNGKDVPAPAAPQHGSPVSKASKLFGTGVGNVYPDPVDGRTFDRYPGEWTQDRSNEVCQFAISCSAVDGFWFFAGTNGMLRAQLGGSSEASGTLTHTWTSPKFEYKGNDGRQPAENVIQYRLRANRDKFADQEMTGGSFKVQVVDEGGSVVAQNSGHELVPHKDWKATRFSVPGNALRVGGTYQLRAITQIPKVGGHATGGTVDWDCVAVTARSGVMTGTEGCGAGDTPPDPGEVVEGGGSSPVCQSTVDPLTGPLLATLRQLFTGPNQLSAGVGSSTSEVVDALLDPARPLGTAIGDLTGTFAATGNGLSGPTGELARRLQPFGEGILKAVGPGANALSGLLTPLAKVLSDTAGTVTKPAGALVAGVLSPAGELAAPLVPVYNALVRPITQPFVSTLMNNLKPAMVNALGPEGTRTLGSLLIPLEEAARGTAGPFTAAIGTLHPVHATLVNLLDPIYTGYLTALGPDAEQYTKFVRSAYVHSFKGFCPGQADTDSPPMPGHDH
ncbi:hypothetical protein [Kutzneria albida]|uniref:Putative secreted protein n=1 Tax=Kutzneria albida DSM 43870 TaxID=1449976 RepID=W5W9I5_9PSEU|nr:hypothetical protein [Kutzneria albida]AHH97181.1 putative secreted protein [Kutzneria albida DSM 43870]